MGKFPAFPHRCRHRVAACCCLLSAVKDRILQQQKKRESKSVHEKLKLKILSSWPRFLVKMLIKKRPEKRGSAGAKELTGEKLHYLSPFYFLFPSHLVCALLRPLYLQRANPPREQGRHTI